MNCKNCGGTFALEDYHIRARQDKNLNLCHSCYRKLPKEHKLCMMDVVSFAAERLGFKPDNPTILAKVKRGEVGLIIGIDAKTDRYLVACGGFAVWALPEHLKAAPINALKYQHELEPISVTDLMLEGVRKDIEEYEKSHKGQ